MATEEVATGNGKVANVETKVAAVEVESLTPYLGIEAPRAQEAIDWYEDVFGFKEIAKHHAEKRKADHDVPLILHAAIKLGSIELFLADVGSWADGAFFKPGTQLKGTNVDFHLQVSDVDALVELAVEKGAKVSLPVENQFWGARYGKIVDPFGVEWALSKQLENAAAAAAAEAPTEPTAEVTTS